MKPLRILIDESLPVELAADLKTHDVTTVRAQGWIGLRNGVLLRAAVAAGFEVLITADRALPYQQNLPKLGIAVVILAGVRNRIDRVRPLVPQILDAIATIKPGESIRITPPRTESIHDRSQQRMAGPVDRTPFREIDRHAFESEP